MAGTIDAIGICPSLERFLAIEEDDLQRRLGRLYGQEGIDEAGEVEEERDGRGRVGRTDKDIVREVLRVVVRRKDESARCRGMLREDEVCEFLRSEWSRTAESVFFDVPCEVRECTRQEIADTGMRRRVWHTRRQYLTEDT